MPRTKEGWNCLVDVECFTLHAKRQHRRKRYLKRRFVKSDHHVYNNNTTSYIDNMHHREGHNGNRKNTFWMENYSHTINDEELFLNSIKLRPPKSDTERGISNGIMNESIEADTNTESEESEPEMTTTQRYQNSSHKKNGGHICSNPNNKLRAVNKMRATSQPNDHLGMAHNGYKRICIPKYHKNDFISARVEHRKWSDVVTGSNCHNEQTQQSQVNIKKRHKLKKILSVFPGYQVDGNTDLSLHTCFSTIDTLLSCCNLNRIIRPLYLPPHYALYLSQLYEDEYQNEVLSLLNSVRVMDLKQVVPSKNTPNTKTLFNLGKEYLISVGVFVDELIEILNKNVSIGELTAFPTELSYIISSFVGSPILCLNVEEKIDHTNIVNNSSKPWLNVIRWSSQILSLDKKNQNDLLFYFSSHICMMEDVKQQLGLNNFKHLHGDPIVNWIDIDWCYIIFLRLGLIPYIHYDYFCFYFSQRLHGRLDHNALLHRSSSI